MISSQMILQMNRHRSPIACHQQKAIGFAPEQNTGVLRSPFWSARIADDPNRQVRLMLNQLGTQSGGNVLI